MFGVSIATYRYNTAPLVHDWALADVGQTYMSALRLLEGQTPYRDFHYQWGPYALFLSAYILKYFGIRISVMKLAITLTVIIATTITYLLGREFLPRFHAFFVALLIHIIFMQVTIIPYANIFVIPVGLSGLLLVVKYGRTERRYLLLVAGILCGIAMGLKLSAGLLVGAGITMALMVADGQYEGFDRSNLLALSNWRVVVPVVLVAGLTVLISEHLNAKYFLLFMAPVMVACLAALKLQGRFEASMRPEQSKARFLKSLLFLGTGMLLGSIPWLGFYLLTFGIGDFYYYLIGSTLEYSKHIFQPYYEIEAMALVFFLFTLVAAVSMWLASKTSFVRYARLLTILIAAGYSYIFLSLLPSNFGEIVNSITFFLPPLTALAAGGAVLAASRVTRRGNSVLGEDTGIIMVLLYHVFFFFVAYPHTEATHLSWSYPTGMICLFYLLEKARRFILGVWPGESKRALGHIIAASLSFILPVSVLLNHALWILGYFYEMTPDSNRWPKREYALLENERAGVYEMVGSAFQIKCLDDFIQKWTREDDYIFEFPTTFFYFYAQRRNPTNCDYFYPGLFSGRQEEFIRDMERTQPRFAIIYDNPEAYIFSYSHSEIAEKFSGLINYIDTHYMKIFQIGHFKMLERVSMPGDVAVVGDWNNDGADTIGFFRDGTWFVDANGDGRCDMAYIAERFSFGDRGSMPVVADFDGAGKSVLALFYERNGVWLVDLNRNRRWDSDGSDKGFIFGGRGDVPVVGDWDGDGTVDIGVFRNGVWLLDLNGNRIWDGSGADAEIVFGKSGDMPVVGDWNGDGVDNVGVYRDGVWLLDLSGNQKWDGAKPDRELALGREGDVPVVGDWNGDGIDEPGLFREGRLVIRSDGEGRKRELVRSALPQDEQP
jgi:hypothetical protein